MAKLGGKIGPAFAVAVIVSVIDAPRIVENGEQLDDFDFGVRGFRQSQAVFENSRPMPDRVGSVPTKRVIFKDRVDEGFEVQGHFVLQPGIQILFATMTSVLLDKLKGVVDCA